MTLISYTYNITTYNYFAYVEATCNANCIGLVKLMGRH